MNHAQLNLERPNQPTETLKEEVLDLTQDPYNSIWNPGDHPHSSVSFTVGRSIGYGEIKVSAHVQLQCDQNAPAIEEAARLAFNKAVELATSGFQLLTAPAQAGT